MDKSFNLGSLLEMNLFRHEETVRGITGQAQQELKIEKAIAEIDGVWRKTEFAYAKYKKAGKVKGWVLRSADDIVLELEDHLLNLQTMGASRFVGPFIDIVSQWNKDLNACVEVIDKWFAVQTKWTYLEGIFIGSDDIRMQLPEAAKAFGVLIAFLGH